MSSAVIIPAAGSGTRFGGDLPKQFHLLRGVPLLVRTISVFTQMPEISAILVAVNKDMQAFASELIEDFYPRRVIVTLGGEERQESIKNTLEHEAIRSADLILVHDAVRPFSSTKLVRSIMSAAQEHGAAIPALTPKETIKQMTRDGFVQQTYKRSTLASVQTPQAFQREILCDAYKLATIDNFKATDDASVVEYAGYTVKVVDGEEDNIKITTRRDWELAERIVALQAQ